MAKKETKIVEEKVVEVGTEQSTDTFNSKAFSIIYEGSKRYKVVCINFNPDTGSCGKAETVTSGLDLYEAHDEFKKQVVNAGLFDSALDN